MLTRPKNRGRRRFAIHKRVNVKAGWYYLAAAAEEQRQQAEREAPARLLAMLKSRGLQVSLSTDGEHITMPPADAAALAPGEVAALKHHRAGIIAALAAEAEAARLVVVA